METTIVYWGYIGVILRYWGYINRGISRFEALQLDRFLSFSNTLAVTQANDLVELLNETRLIWLQAVLPSKSRYPPNPFLLKMEASSGGAMRLLHQEVRAPQAHPHRQDCNGFEGRGYCQCKAAAYVMARVQACRPRRGTAQSGRSEVHFAQAAMDPA